MHDSAPNTTAYKITCNANAPATTTAPSHGGTSGGTPPATTNRGITALPGSTTASPANSLQSAVALVVAAAAVLYI